MTHSMYMVLFAYIYHKNKLNVKNLPYIHGFSGLVIGYGYLDIIATFFLFIVVKAVAANAIFPGSPTSPPKKLLFAQVGIDPKGMMAGDILR